MCDIIGVSSYISRDKFRGVSTICNACTIAISVQTSIPALHYMLLFFFMFFWIFNRAIIYLYIQARVKLILRAWTVSIRRQEDKKISHFEQNTKEYTIKINSCILSNHQIRKWESTHLQTGTGYNVCKNKQTSLKKKNPLWKKSQITTRSKKK